jgi:predicted amidohydrolase
LDYAGGSAVYAPDGEPLALAGDQAGQVEATLDFEALTALRQAFPVALDADSFDLKS